MSLYGELGEVALVDIVQILHISAKSGTLILQSRAQSGKIHLKKGDIVGATSPNSRQNLGEVIISEGFCDAAEVQDIVLLQKSLTEYKPLGTLLVDKGKITFEQLRDAILMQIKLSLIDLISWDEGNFYFEAGEPDVLDEIAYLPEELFPTLNLDTRHLLLEALRIFDENQKQLEANKAASRGGAMPSGPTVEQVEAMKADPLLGLESADEQEVSGDVVVMLTSSEILADLVGDEWNAENFRSLVIADSQKVQSEIEQLTERAQEPLVMVDIDGDSDGGQQLIDWVRKSLPKLQVIAMTASTSFADHADLMKRGVRSVLLKPQDFDDAKRSHEFLEVCRQAISGYYRHKSG